MKTKKLLAVIITIAMIAGLFAMTTTPASAAITTVTFNSLSYGYESTLTSHGGITWNVAGNPYPYRIDIEAGVPFIWVDDGGSSAELTMRFSLPSGNVLKAINVFAGSGTLKVSSANNPERTVAFSASCVWGVGETLITEWTQPDQLITLKMQSPGGAWGICFCSFTYGLPSDVYTPPTTVATIATSSTTAVPTTATTANPTVPATEAPVTGVSYYVKTNGNDSLDGKSINNAFKTIQKAADIMQAGDICYILEGTYREKVVPKNSGTSDKPIRFKNYQGQKVTISGADILTSSWSVHEGNIYKTNVGAARFDQLFVNDMMNLKARWPNNPSLDLLAGTQASTTGTRNSITHASIPKVDLDGAQIWINPGSGSTQWVGYNRTIQKFTPSTGHVLISGETFPDWGHPGMGSIFYIFDSLALLDAEGEWYLDKTNGDLYLYPVGGGSPASRLVEYKARDTALDISNKSHISVDGIDVYAATIYMNNSSYCTVKNGTARYITHFEDQEGYEIRYDGIYISGNNNLFDNMTIRYSAGSGVAVRGIKNTVSNCNIQDVGYSGGEYAGIMYGVFDFEEVWVKHDPPPDKGQHTGLVIYKNVISRCGRSGMLAHYTEDSYITYNVVSDIGLLCVDLGNIYIDKDGNREDSLNVLAYNTFYGNKRNVTVGIYFDGGQDYLVHNNLVYDVGPNSAALVINGTQYYQGLRRIYCYNNTLIGGVDIGPASPNGSNYRDIRLINNILRGSFNTRGITTTWRQCPVTGITYLIGEGFRNENNYTGDPLFVSMQTGDYRLSANSPCRDLGQIIEGFSTGFNLPRPDVGAFEYGEKLNFYKVNSIEITGAGGATAITTDGANLQMSASILPSEATFKTVMWTVIGGTGTAAISTSGLLSAKSDGTVTVRASAVDGTAVFGERVITLSNQTGNFQPTDPLTSRTEADTTTNSSGTVLLPKKGDINGDGKVNGMDLLLMKQHILDVPDKDIKPGTNAFKAADMNDDGKINGMDLLALKKVILK